MILILINEWQLNQNTASLPNALQCCNKALLLKMEMEFIKCQEKETRGMQMPVPQCSMAEREIVDEAFRYGSYSNLRVGESSLSSSSLFGQTPERESCDHYRDLRVGR